MFRPFPLSVVVVAIVEEVAGVIWLHPKDPEQVLAQRRAIAGDKTRIEPRNLVGGRGFVLRLAVSPVDELRFARKDRDELGAIAASAIDEGLVHLVNPR